MSANPIQDVVRTAMLRGAVSAMVHGLNAYVHFEARDERNSRHGHACIVVGPDGVSIAEYDQKHTPQGAWFSRELAEHMAALDRVRVH